MDKPYFRIMSKEFVAKQNKMKHFAKSKDKSKVVTDEKFNSVSHTFGAILAMFGGVLLIVNSSISGDPYKIVGSSIYAVALLLLFVASALHHGINSRHRVENILRTLDYNSVFLLIAGTFTPICFVLLKNAFGWAVFGCIWALAIIGIVLRSSIKDFPMRYTNVFYITMGWLGGFVFIAVLKIVELNDLFLFLLGGIVYSIGFLVFVFEKPNFIPGKFCYHEVWHILVLIAALFHYLFVYRIIMLY